jgi:diguanylate cyclase (GGDEF)-like protein
MGALWRRWLGDPAVRDDVARPPSDPRRGTYVALGFPVVALAAAWASAGAGDTAFGGLGLPATLALAVVAAVFGRHPIQLGPRTLYALETPTVLLAGLLGGPLAGAVVGAGSGLGDIGGVWRRRAAYAGIAAIQGVVSGHAGVAWHEGRLGPAAAAALGAACTVGVSAAGIALVQLDRGTLSVARLRWTALTDAVGLAVALPPVLLMVVSFEARPALVLATLVSVAATATIAARFGERREEAAAERHQGLLLDWLTGAASRGFFEVELERAREGVLRGQLPAGLLVVDADHFKRVNDTWGHMVGDGVLQELVHRIGRCARASDLVARWGGEEFCVLAPGLGGVHELIVLAERIRAEVASAPFAVGEFSIEMTVSVGGTLVDGAVHAAAVFDHADRALYRAKESRNATCVLSPPAPAARVGNAAAATTAPSAAA